MIYFKQTDKHFFDRPKHSLFQELILHIFLASASNSGSRANYKKQQFRPDHRHWTAHCGRKSVIGNSKRRQSVNIVLSFSIIFLLVER